MSFNPEAEYVVRITDTGLACEHPVRAREAIAWADVAEISVVTSGEGPLGSDVWVLFVGDEGGCSIPLGATGFDQLHEAFKRFEGFDYKAFIESMSSTENATFVCWTRA